MAARSYSHLLQQAVAGALEASGESTGDDAPDALPPTGQYPDDVWAQVDYSAHAQGLDTTAPAAPVETPPAPAPVMPAAPVVAPGVVLDNQEMIYLVRQVAEPRSGADIYTAVNAPSAPGEGVRFGLLQLRQESGELGALLTIMQRRDPSLFATVFGGSVADLLRVTTAATPAERLAPVGGKSLWEADWLERFRQAALQPTFQAAQNEFAIEEHFRPLLPGAPALGIRSDRGLAMLYELLLSLGRGEALAWAGNVLAAAGEAAQAGENVRLSLLVQAAQGEIKERLLRLQNSPALDGTIYDSLPLPATAPEAAA